MLNRIAKQPVSLLICLAWIVIWILVTTKKMHWSFCAVKE